MTLNDLIIKLKYKNFETIMNDIQNQDIEVSGNNVYYDDDLETFFLDIGVKIKFVDNMAILSDKRFAISVAFSEITNRFDDKLPMEMILDFSKVKIML